MKITGVRTQPFRMNMQRPLGDANGPSGRDVMAATAVFIDSDDGLLGISMAHGCGGLLTRMVNDLLVGKDPRGESGHWNTMVNHVFKGDNRGVTTAAIAAIDTALWDLKAKINDEPLWKTLGASTRRVRAYASGIDLPLSDDQLREYYAATAGPLGAAGPVRDSTWSDQVRVHLRLNSAIGTGTGSLIYDRLAVQSPRCVFVESTRGGTRTLTSVKDTGF